MMRQYFIIFCVFVQIIGFNRSALGASDILSVLSCPSTGAPVCPCKMKAVGGAFVGVGGFEAFRKIDWMRFFVHLSVAGGAVITGDRLVGAKCPNKPLRMGANALSGLLAIYFTDLLYDIDLSLLKEKVPFSHDVEGF